MQVKCKLTYGMIKRKDLAEFLLRGLGYGLWMYLDPIKHVVEKKKNNHILPTQITTLSDLGPE